MKKLYLILLFLAIVFSATAQTIGDAFYIYRNDGGFNAFFRDEVDSIAYSHYDLDSLYYDENVTQLVYTADSLYRIPLAAIDSVAFVTPETTYKPGVIKLEDNLINYLNSVNGDTLVFALSIPTSIIPRVGDRLVTIKMSDFFPLGFAAEVVKVENISGGIEVIYEDIELADAFDCLFVTSEDSPAKSRVRRLEGNGSRTLSPGPFTFGGWTELVAEELQLDDDYAFTFSPELSFTYTPKLWVSGMVIITKEIGHYFSFTCTGEHELVEHFASTGKLSWEKKAGINVPTVKLPICPFLEVFFEPGLFFKAETEISSNITFTQRFNTALHYEWSSKGKEGGKNTATIRTVSNDMSGTFMINGSISFGAFFEVGVQAFNRPFLKKQNKDWGSLKARLEMGWIAESNAVITKVETEQAKASTALYERLKDTSLTFSKYWATSLTFQPIPWISLTAPLPFGNKEEIGRLGHVPAFDQTTLQHDGDNNDILIAKTNARGTLFRPVGVGFVLQDENGNEVDSHLFNTEYRNQNIPLEHAFVPTINSVLTVYPLVRWNGIEMLAEPKAEEKGETTCPDANHPHWIDMGIGTQWRCCNAGASSPEEYGGYYTFDEAQAYNPPSLDQIKTLVSNCSYTWTTQNGVYGGKFTGPNGGTIFLPAAGYRWDGEFNDVGSWGIYWSSALIESDPSRACGLSFRSGHAGWSGLSRLSGLSVRPVR